MKKVLIVTRVIDEKLLISILQGTGITMDGIVVQVVDSLDHVDWIRCNRPEMIILDANIEDMKLGNMHIDFGDAVHRYDMPCNFFSINAKVHLPGVTFLEKLSEIEELRKN